MKKTMIHFDAVKHNSEVHNNRSVKLSYVRSDLAHLNESWIENNGSISEREILIKDFCKQKSGRAMQKNAIPIREAVILINEHHTMLDLHQLAEELKNELGINTFQIYIHRDEGHYNETGQWEANLHAHLVCDFQNKQTGKMLGLNKLDMSKLQDVTAKVLQMQRGNSKSSVRLSAIEYKIEIRKEELRRLESNINALSNEISIGGEELIVYKKNFFGVESINFNDTFKNYQEIFERLELQNRELKINNDKLNRQNNQLLDTKEENRLLKVKSAAEKKEILTNVKSYQVQRENIKNEVFKNLEKEFFQLGFSNPSFFSMDKSEQNSLIKKYLDKLSDRLKLDLQFISAFKDEISASLAFIQKGISAKMNKSLKNRAR